MRRSGWGPSEKDPHPRAPRRRPTSALWHNLAEHAEKTVARHRGCWAQQPAEDRPPAEPDAPPDLRELAAQAALARREASALAIADFHAQ